MCPDKERPAENTTVLLRGLTRYGGISVRQNRACPCQSMVAFTRKTTEGSTEIDNGGADKITDYAKTAMQWAVGSGFVKGKSGNLLDPQGTATRAEIAVMIHRFIEKYELVQARLPAA